MGRDQNGLIGLACLEQKGSVERSAPFFCVPAQEGRAEGTSAIDTTVEAGTFHHNGRIVEIRLLTRLSIG
jgi:hypothetical protein